MFGPVGFRYRQKPVASKVRVIDTNATAEAMTKTQSRGDWMRHRQQLEIFYGVLREASGNALLRARLETLSAQMSWLRGVTRAVASAGPLRNMLRRPKPYTPEPIYFDGFQR